MATYTLTLKQLVENNIDIFDFDYPITPTYKEEFERKFIDNFYFDEIGFETVGRFKWQLKKELNLIMPYYNKIYMSQGLEQRILDNYDIVEEYERTTNNSTNANTSNDGKTTMATTPVRKTNINTIDYVDSINMDNSSTNTSASDSGSEKWKRTMSGNIGIQYDGQAVTAFENSLRMVDLEVFERLSILFMGVY